MKTHRISKILKMITIGLILTTGSTAVFAQGRGHGNDHRSKEDRRNYKEERRSYRGERGRSYHYAGPAYGHDRVYYSQAPWGSRLPYVMSYNQGRLYYYRGHYYDYLPERGYFIVEAPYGYEFDEVPRGFARVRIDNTWCYHRGDFYLRPSAHGYISFNRPGLSVGVGF
jgi:hypothetical protein